MNLIIIENHELNDGNVTLSDHRCTHIRKVLRSKPGDTIKIGLLNGSIGHGTIIKLSKSEVLLEIILTEKPPATPQTDLILALPRPIMLKRILSQATQMGVRNIYLINANRVEKSFFNASALQEESINTFLKRGLEQAIDTRVPTVSIHSRFRPFVEDYLPEIMTSENTLGLIGHPSSENSLSETATNLFEKQILLAIGPEGGWVDFEITKFHEQGFFSFSMGQRILRVDSAVPALMAQVQLLRELKE